MIFWTGAPVVVEKPPAKQRVASATQPPWKMDQGSIKTDWFFPVTSNLELQWWIIFFWYSTLNIVLQFWMMDYIIKSPKQINPTTNSSKLWRLLFFLVGENIVFELGFLVWWLQHDVASVFSSPRPNVAPASGPAKRMEVCHWQRLFKFICNSFTMTSNTEAVNHFNSWPKLRNN